MSSAALQKQGNLIANALRYILKRDKTNEGASLESIYARLDVNTKKKLSKADLRNILTKSLLPHGKTFVLENGNFQITDPPASAAVQPMNDVAAEVKEPPLKVKEAQTKTPKPALKKPPAVTPVAVNVTPRERSERKRVQKVVFDPSDVEPPKKKVSTKKLETSGAANCGESEEKEFQSPTSEVCKVCSNSLTDSADSGFGETMECEDCRCKVHASCTKVADIRQSRWRCEDCKTCATCRGKRTSRGEPLIQCVVCNESYHLKCAHARRVKPSQDWLCSTCRRIFPGDSDGKDEQSSDSSHSLITSGRASPDLKPKAGSRRQSRDSVKKESKADDEEEVIPDCSEWTPEQVHRYFMLFVPSNDAQVFLDQEIDGRILLMLNRSDVLTRFNLKLGPALKIYSLVKRLQERSSDIRLCWP